MVILSIRFTSSLSQDEVVAVVRDRFPQFRQVPGLVQKFYAMDGSGHYTGIYLFDTQASLDAYRESELAKSIPASYRVEDVRIEQYEFLGALFDQTPTLATILP